MLSVIVTSMIALSPTIKPTTNNFKYYGDTMPLGYFDPLKLSTPENSKYLREFELQHGRAAMMASVLIPAFELMTDEKLGIDYLAKMDLNSQLPFWYVMALIEFFRMNIAWENPFGGKPLFTLRDDFQPGNYLNYNVNNVSDRAFNSELNNGRLAMLAVAHMIASELVTGVPITQF